MAAQPILERIAPFFDPQLLLPIVSFAKDNGADASEAFAKLSGLTTATKTTDLKTKTLMKQIESLLKEFFSQEGDTIKLKLAFYEVEERRKNGGFENDKLKEVGVKPSQVELLFELGFHLFAARRFKESADCLSLYQAMKSDSMDEERELSVLWGRLAADQLAGNWGAAINDIDRLRSALVDSSQTLVISRVWLLHWSLFTYFQTGHPKTSLLIDHVFEFPHFTYLNVIECMAPHLLRYLAAACIITRRRAALRRLARIIEQDSPEYNDSFTNFVNILVNTSEFDKVTDLLGELKTEAEADFFLAPHAKELLDNAKKLIFEDYLKVHKTVSIKFVAEKVKMDQHETELWLANLIREAKIEGKIDSVGALVTVNTTKTSFHKRVLDRLDCVDRPAL